MSVAQAGAAVPKTLPRIAESHQMNWVRALQGRDAGQLAVRIRRRPQRDDGARRRRAARRPGAQGDVRRREDAVHQRARRQSILDARIPRRMGSLTMRLHTVIIAGAVVAGACAHAPTDGAQWRAGPRAESERGWRPLFDGTIARRLARLQEPTRFRRVARSSTERSPRIAACRRHHDARSNSANFELELDWKIGDGRQQRHLLSRHRGVRPHLLERAGVSAARQHRTRPTTRRRSRAAARRTVCIRAPDGHVKPVGEWNTTRIVVDSGARRALAQRLQDGRSTSCGAPIGRRRSQASKFDA